ncbi:hypothetical protein [Microcoleus sp. OTE_8_concoct_300]
MLVEEAARVAQKSSCTAQSCYEQQWTANRQTGIAVWRLTEYLNILCSRPAVLNGGAAGFLGFSRKPKTRRT